MNRSQDRHSGSAVAVPVSLPFNHPLLELYIPVAKSLSPAAERTAALMVESAPGQGLDIDTNRDYFSSLPMDRMLNRANQRSLAAAAHGIEKAHAMAMAQTELLDRADDLASGLEELEEDVVDAAGVQLKRADAPELLNQAQAAAIRSEARHDYEHRKVGAPGAAAWIVVACISLFESVGVYAFMVNLSDFKSLAVLVALTGLLVLTNHLSTQWVGEALRAYRQKRRTRLHAHTAAYGLSHSAIQHPTRRKSDEHHVPNN